MAKFIIGLFCIVMLAGCAHRYYAPVTQNVPLFEEKGETRVSYNFGNTDETSFLNLMAAYALTDNYAVHANFNLMFTDPMGGLLFDADLGKGGEGGLAFG